MTRVTNCANTPILEVQALDAPTASGGCVAFGAVAWTVHLAGFVIGIVYALLSRPGIAKRLRA